MGISCASCGNVFSAPVEYSDQSYPCPRCFTFAKIPRQGFRASRRFPYRRERAIRPRSTAGPFEQICTCGEILSIPGNLVGREVECNSCGSTFTAKYTLSQIRPQAFQAIHGVSLRILRKLALQEYVSELMKRSTKRAKQSGKTYASDPEMSSHLDFSDFGSLPPPRRTGAQNPSRDSWMRNPVVLASAAVIGLFVLIAVFNSGDSYAKREIHRAVQDVIPWGDSRAERIAMDLYRETGREPYMVGHVVAYAFTLGLYYSVSEADFKRLMKSIILLED